MMARSALLKHLAGPDRRSVGGASRAVKLVCSKPALFQDLLLEMWSPDLLVRMRAADNVEKVTRRRGGFLQPYKNKLLELAEETSQQEMQWHLAQMVPRLELTKPRAAPGGSGHRKVVGVGELYCEDMRFAGAV